MLRTKCGMWDQKTRVVSMATLIRASGRIAQRPHSNSRLIRSLVLERLTSILMRSARTVEAQGLLLNMQEEWSFTKCLEGRQIHMTYTIASPRNGRFNLATQ